MSASIRNVGNQWQSSTYSARSRFRPSFYPNEHGTRSDEIPSLDVRQPLGDERQEPPSDGFEDNVAVAGVPDADVCQRRSLHHTHRFCVEVEREGAAPRRLYIWVLVNIVKEIGMMAAIHLGRDHDKASFATMYPISNAQWKANSELILVTQSPRGLPVRGRQSSRGIRAAQKQLAFQTELAEGIVERSSALPERDLPAESSI